jgi:hypothetical protein
MNTEERYVKWLVAQEAKLAELVEQCRKKLSEFGQGELEASGTIQRMLMRQYDGLVLISAKRAEELREKLEKSARKKENLEKQAVVRASRKAHRQSKI